MLTHDAFVHGPDDSSNLTDHLVLGSSYSKGIQTPGRHVRTRLYFTSESHVHSLLSVIRYGGLVTVSGLAHVG